MRQELKNSNNLKDRKLYLDLVKDELKRSQQPYQLIELDKFTFQVIKYHHPEFSAQCDEIIILIDKINQTNQEDKYIENLNKKWIAWLKKELSTYDVYKQNFNNYCQTCKELKEHCLCELLITH